MSTCTGEFGLPWNGSIALMARDYSPIILLEGHDPAPDVSRYLRAADVCVVSSLHDGMNLVAKEFVRARTDQRGVLVLSTFAGAARSLDEALLINPFDPRGTADVLARALAMPEAEQRARMVGLRRTVSSADATAGPPTYWPTRSSPPFRTDQTMMPLRTA